MTPIPLGNWVRPYQPGDKARVKDWKKEPLQPVWTGPHTVVLVTSTAVKIIGVTPWIHHTTGKTAAASVTRTSGKQFETPRTHPKSGSKSNSPALVPAGAD